ncbi:DeoR/GlpR family DNA-binding transcription regulator [Bradyrhizobium sp. 2TAF24]|uniref:DeoR/GlpR family DNA-binding transcription regulator n=1 Tax=Bradyrhizobium sp. 2TAF24 TaxID=3233011 RepID=UPI003F919313
MPRIADNERQAWILERVREQGFASIEQLAARFDVTQQTIRRIVNRLCDEGLLRRIHGGVGLPVPNQNVAYESRQVLNLEAKRRIARAAAGFVPDGASVMIGLGTTPECVALALSHRKGVHVITNSLNAASAFARNAELDITMAGGTLRRHDRDIIGDAAVSFFSRFKADVGIFGVGGVDDDGSLLDFYAGEVEARQAIAANCRTALLVVDHSKFGRNATVRGGHLGDHPHVFTDQPVPEPFRALFDGQTRVLHVAGAE